MHDNPELFAKLIQAALGATGAFAEDQLDPAIRERALFFSRMNSSSRRGPEYLIGRFLGTLALEGRVGRKPI